MKTTFRADELAHAFIHKAAPEGNVRGSRMASFHGDAFYSYSTVIARHGIHAGKSYLIRDTSSFSSFTGRVQSRLYHALDPSVPVFYFNQGYRGQDLRVTPAQLFNHAVEQSAKCEEKAQRARANKGGWQAHAAEWLERASQINTFFGLRRKVDAKTVERLKDAAAREERKNAVLRKKQEAERAVREAEELEKYRARYESWKLHGDDGNYFPVNRFPVAFRIEENELVSTLGARVPLDAARVALRFILRKRGQDWRANGDRCPVGHYELSAINAAGVVAGCHRFDWQEVERVAGLLGFVPRNTDPVSAVSGGPSISNRGIVWEETTV